MNIRLWPILLLIVGGNVFGQSLRVADRYFKEFAFVESAKIYEALVLQKGDSSKHVLSRLADSYYNNADTEQAEKWYEKLVQNFEEIDNYYLFKYAQVLRSNGRYKKSDSILQIYASKGEHGNLSAELENEDYLLDISETEEKRISVRNLGINTPLSDFGGFLLNGKVYFTSALPKNTKRERIYKWNNQPFLNIYKSDEDITTLEESKKDTILRLVNQELFEAPITTDLHESTPVFTKDGKTIYFTRNNSNGKKIGKDKKNISNLKIYKADLVNGYWINVTELPFNSDEFSVGHPALSTDEKTLYFVSNMPGGKGATDIYSVSIDEDGTFGTPENLGDKINTSGREMFPFVGADNTLYFSSDGHLGLGLLDIFQSKIRSDKTFSTAKNLGYPFNSKRDDFSFFIAEEGKKGFFSSNRKQGKGDDDIYSFFIYADPPICYQKITGVISNSKTNDRIDGAVIKLVGANGEVLKETVSNLDGSYVFNEVLCGGKYTVQVSKFDHRSNKASVSVGANRGEKVKKNVSLTPLIIGNQIVINPIYFDYNRALIRDDAQYELENIVTVMTNHPGVVIKIESHTDSRGGKDYNRKLSDRRAKATRDYIASRGISKDRIESAVGYGEDQLLNDCDDSNKKCSDADHQKNRRSYFYIVKGGENIKARQQAEKIKVQKRVSRRNNFLQFLRKNFKKTDDKENNKCLKEGEDCTEDKTLNQIKL